MSLQRRAIVSAWRESRSSAAPIARQISLQVPSSSKLRLHAVTASTPQRFTRQFASQTRKFKQATISEDEYHKLADDCFEALTESLEELVESSAGSDSAEVEFASGVITFSMGREYGTYVINKQPPNKQIWFSSPRSGPKRFDYDSDHQTWFMIKDGEAYDFKELFTSELRDICQSDVDVRFSNKN